VQFIRCIASKTGLLENVNLDLSGSTTVIFGKNGSGKSLLARSLVDAMLGEFSDVRLLHEGTRESLFIDLIFSLSSEDRYEIICNRDKYFTIEHLNSREKKLLYTRADSEFAGGEENTDLSLHPEGSPFLDFTNRVDADFFLATSFMPSPSDMEAGVTIDYGSIKKLMLQDRSDFFRLHNELSHILEHGSLQENSPLSRIALQENILRDLNRNVQIVELKNSRAAKLEKEKTRIKREIRELEKNLSDLSGHNDIMIKILESLGKIEDLNRNLELIRQEVEIEKNRIRMVEALKKDIIERFPQFRKLGSENSPNLDAIQNIFNKLRNINEQIDNTRTSMDSRKKRLKKAALFVLLSAVTAVMSILYKNSFQPDQDIMFISGILLAGLAAIPALLVYHRLTEGRDRLNSLIDDRASIEEDLESLLKASGVTVEDFKLVNLYEFLLKYFEDYIEYTERNRDLNSMQSSLKSRKYLVEIEEKLNSLKNEENSLKSEIQENLKFLGSVYDIKPEREKLTALVQDTSHEIKLINEKIDAKENILEQVERELEGGTENDEALTGLRQLHAEAEKRMRTMCSWRDSFLHLNEMLTEAVMKREEKQLNSIICRSLEIFNDLTENRHASYVDRYCISEIIQHNRAPRDMGKSVLHMILLSIKLALTDFLIDSGTPLPLIIDDPFQFMDEDRIQCLKKLILDISGRRQIIIFTHQKLNGIWGNHVTL